MTTRRCPLNSEHAAIAIPPAAVFPEIPSNGLLPLPDGIGTAYIPANQKIPYVDQWNFTIEHAIASGLNFSAGYVGNIGRHLNSGFNLNAAIPGPGDFNSRRPLFFAGFHAVKAAGPRYQASHRRVQVF